MKKTVFVLLMLAVALLPARADWYNIRQYGAVSDTTQLSTQAIQKAIDACSQNGGGRVIIPAGNYKTGSLVLRSNVHLHLETGATLYGSTRWKTTRR